MTADRFGKYGPRPSNSTGAGRSRLRANGWHVVQCACAAAVAWWIAADLLGHDLPYFAPVAAAVGLGVSFDHRLRRVGEVAVGVSLGVLVADLVGSTVGTGALQVAGMVSLAMAVALYVDGSPVLVMQASTQAVAVSTLRFEDGAALTHWLDAAVGGMVAIGVSLLGPLNPFETTRRMAGETVREIGHAVSAVADVIAEGDDTAATDLVGVVAKTSQTLAALGVAAEEGVAVARQPLARSRVRAEADEVDRLVASLQDASASVQHLARLVTVAIYRGQSPPADWSALHADLAAGCALLAAAVESTTPLTESRRHLTDIGISSLRLDRECAPVALAILVTLRSLVIDLLRATGLDEREATDLIPKLDY